MEIKHGLLTLSGVALLFFGMPQLPVASGSVFSAVFSLAWSGILLLHIFANIRQMKRVAEQKKKRQEALRRLQWLEAEREWKRCQMKIRRIKSVSI